MTTTLTYAEAIKSEACYDCGDASARCSYCGESASAHDLSGPRGLVCGTDVCDEAGIGEFYPAEPWVLAHDRETGGVQLESFCPTHEREREARNQRLEAAAARARGEDC